MRQASSCASRSRHRSRAGIDVPQPIVEALYRFQNEERTVSFSSSTQTVDRAGRRARRCRRCSLLRGQQGAISARPNTASSALLVARPGRDRRPGTRSRTRRSPPNTSAARRASRARAPAHRADSASTTQEAAEAALQTDRRTAPTSPRSRRRPARRSADLDLGLKTKAEILDPAVAEAAFAAEPNTVVPVIEGALEPSLIRVTEIEPGSVTPLAEVAPRLRAGARDARRRAKRCRTSTTRSRTSAPAAPRWRRSARAVAPLSRRRGRGARTARRPTAAAIADLPAKRAAPRRGLRERRRRGEQPAARRRATPTSSTTCWRSSRSATARSTRCATRSSTAWKAEETRTASPKRPTRCSRRLQKGEPIATLAAEIGKPVQTAENVKRGAPPAGLSANAAAQAFAGPEGHVANAEGDAPPERILLKVDKVTAPAFFAEAADVAGDQGAARRGAQQRPPAVLQPAAPRSRARRASTTPPSRS